MVKFHTEQHKKLLQHQLDLAFMFNKWMVSKNLTVADLMKKMSCSQGHLYRIKTGRCALSPEIAEELCTKFDMPKNIKDMAKLAYSFRYNVQHEHGGNAATYLMEKQGLTALDFETKTGISKFNVYKFNHKKSVRQFSVKLLTASADFLGITVDELLKTQNRLDGENNGSTTDNPG